MHGFLQLLDVLGRELRTVNGQGQLGQGSVELERHLVILVIHAGKRVGADVKVFVPLQRKWNRLRHRDALHFFAVHFQHAGAGTAEAGDAVKGQGSSSQPVVGEDIFQCMLAGASASGACHLIRSKSSMFQVKVGLPLSK